MHVLLVVVHVALSCAGCRGRRFCIRIGRSVLSLGILPGWGFGKYGLGYFFQFQSCLRTEETNERRECRESKRAGVFKRKKEE